MADVLVQGALWFGIICVAAIVLIAAVQVTQWAVVTALAVVGRSLYLTVQFVLGTARRLAHGVQAALRFIACLAWRATVTWLAALTRPMQEWLEAKVGVFSEAWRRWIGGPERTGKDWRAQNGAGARDDRSTHGTRDDSPQGRRDSYDDALELLGLHGVEPLTREALKERVREIMSRIHPDKGFPNHVFAQQINAAAQRIKKAKGWR